MGYGIGSKKTNEPKVLCGDFNIPQAETFKGQLITFAQKIKQKGKPKLKFDKKLIWKD